PILSIRGHVDFEANIDRGLFELNFNGTFKVMYLGNLGSVAGRFILNTQNPNDDDAVSLRDLFDDLHIPVPSNPTIDYDAVKLPKLWGVIKMESNLAVLQQIGIDLGIAGVLEVNTTQHLKDETLTLEGIPGDELQQTNRPDPTPPLINLLNAGTLPQSLRNLFTTS